MLPQTGERQVAENIEGIKPNHRQRYQFACDKLVERFAGAQQIRVLDAACGIGYGTMMLADTLPEAYVIGVDVFPEAIEAAKRAYNRSNNDFSVLDLADPAAWPYDVGELDAIVSIETIEHVADGDSLIRRFADTAKFLVASVPNEAWVPFDKSQHPFHYRHYHKNEFEQLLNDYGYTVESWVTQYDKIPGEIYEADDGMGFIVSASKA